VKLPESFASDINKAIVILKEIGFEELYLFGSLAKNTYNDDSDIDLAVKGLPDNKFFYALGKLYIELDHNIDLINLDKPSDFNHLIINNKELLQIV